MDRNTGGWPKAEAFAPTGFGPGGPAGASNPRSGFSRPPSPLPDRFWSQLMVARVLIALVLLALQAYLHTEQGAAPWWPLLLCSLYLLVTLASLRWARPAPQASAWSPGWALTLWVDLGVFAALQALPSASAMAYTPLFFFPVLLAAILGPLLLALGAAATATLALLGHAWLQSLQQASASPGVFVQAALTGAGLFVVGALANQLARRLLSEQSAARHSQQLASAEAEVNGLIVAGLKEGVLVLAPDGGLWHANHAARTMLGAGAHAQGADPLTQTPAWPVLQAWVDSHRHQRPEAAGELALPQPGGQHRRLRLRLRCTDTALDEQAGHAQVLFLEDLRDIEQRIQTEKLAAMGRMSAAVAHEIRNPLAAITQANALLAEDRLLPQQQRLTQMIGHNALRLGRTVDDILNLVQAQPVQAHAGNTPALDPWVQRLVQEWVVQHPQGERLGMLLQAPGRQVLFDPEHLRRVLVNLLDNAHRHADNAPTAIRVSSQCLPAAPDAEADAEADAPRLRLTVWSQGPPLDERVRPHLFEPFVSSGSRSSGLGLYICRELCARYHATLHYQRLDDMGSPGNAFHLTLPCWTPDPADTAAPPAA